MMSYFNSDLYPNGIGYRDTSNSVTPDAETQKQMHVSEDITDLSSQESNGKQILLAMGIIAGLVVFFGTD